MQALGINADRVLVEGVLSDEVEEVWPLIAGKIRIALENGGSLEEPESIRGALMDQEMQLWLIKDLHQVYGVAVSRIEVCDKALVLQIVALSGEGMEGWLEEFERVMRVFGAARGCKYLALTGRRGWLKALKKLSWYESAVIMHKEL